MTCACAPALIALRKEVDDAYPRRDTASDGCCASAAHSAQNPYSDHEPGRDGTAKGLARAYDLDEDLTPDGPGPDDLVGLLMLLYGTSVDDAEPRVKYLIYEGRIYYPHDGTRPRGSYPYTGANAHKSHLHISIFDWAVHVTSPWLIRKDGLAVDVSEERFKKLEDKVDEIYQQLVGLGGTDTTRPIREPISEIHKAVGAKKKP